MKTLQMAKVFRPADREGWYYMLDMQTPVGPFVSQLEAGKAARATIVAEAEAEPDAEADDPEPVSAVFRFWVPVYVTVEDGKVTEVHVDDSAPARGYHDVQPDPDLIEGEGEDLLSAAVSAAFDGDQDWPAWEFGW